MAAPWRVANSLNVLLNQINQRFPRRSKASDGSIGDASHSSRESDHNPDPAGVVRARDFTHDPNGGLDCQWLANVLVASRDPRIKYIIWNGRILSGAAGPSPWAWRAYTGPNPHTKHLHLSVVADDRGDGTALWAGFTSAGPPTPEEDDMDQNEKLRRDWDGKEITVKTALLETWQNSYDALATARDNNAMLKAVLAQGDGELTEGRLLDIMTQASQANLDKIGKVVREAAQQALGADNADLADAIVDGVAARLAN